MELWDLYDSDRRLNGKTMVRGEPVPEGCWHIVVHICLFNRKGEMLIQQRQLFKEGWSGLWDVTTGGSSVAGDTSSSAAERELFEEVGIRLSFEDRVPDFSFGDRYSNVLDDWYFADGEADPDSLTLQYEEVKQVKWASKEEILSMIGDGSFIPYHPSFIELLFCLHAKGSLRFGGDHTVQAPKPSEA